LGLPLGGEAALGWDEDDPRQAFTLTVDPGEFERTVYDALDEVEATLRDDARYVRRYSGDEVDEVTGEPLHDPEKWANAVKLADADLERREALLLLLARLGEQRFDAWRDDDGRAD
jgi:hypothetical protein